jgi:hypothetical protein
VLTETGAIAVGSPLPSQLGADGCGVTVLAAAEIPAPWASVIAHRDEPASDADISAPLGCLLPAVDGARLALSGLSTTAGGELPARGQQSGLPWLARRYQRA